MITLPAELYYIARTSFEAQMASCHALAHAALDSGASLLNANVNALRAQLAAATAASNQLLDVRAPQDLLCLAAREAHEALGRTRAYGRQLAGVASPMHPIGESWTRTLLEPWPALR